MAFSIHIYRTCIFHAMSVSVGHAELKSVILFRTSLTTKGAEMILMNIHILDCVQPVCLLEKHTHADYCLLSILLSQYPSPIGIQ